MKKLLDYGVQEMNIEEKVNVVGGWTYTYTGSDGIRYTAYRRWNNGVVETYKTTWVDASGRTRSSITQSGQGINVGSAVPNNSN